MTPLLLALACTPRPQPQTPDSADTSVPQPDPELCDNGLDDDGDGRIDCLDPDCTELCPEDCHDGWDNDADNLEDCDDPECALQCVEDCDDAFDNDNDMLVDCWDPDCEGDPACTEDCSDGIDNDDDGRIDCQDAECAGLVEPCIEDCSDGIDNDLDGRVDCEDGDCSVSCTELDCSDGLDEDGDSRTDCDDADCWGVGTCSGKASLRVLGGVSEHLSLYSFSSSYSMSGEAHNATKIYGTAFLQDADRSLACDWSADRLFVFETIGSRRELSYEVVSSSTFIHTYSVPVYRQGLRFSGFASTGACGGFLTSAAVSFASSAEETPLPDRVDFPSAGELSLDSTPFIVQADRYGTIVGARTEPWVFWEEE